MLTNKVNAKRLARMVTTPVVAGVSAMLFDFRTNSQQYAMNFPQLRGRLFKDLAYMFESASVIGVFPATTHTLLVNPSPGYVLQVQRPPWRV